MTKPYSDNNPYKRRFQKKDMIDSEPDQSDSNEDSEMESETEPSTTKPKSSVSKDALKRRLNKDKYSV